MAGATASACRSTARSGMPSTAGRPPRSWRTTTPARRWGSCRRARRSGCFSQAARSYAAATAGGSVFDAYPDTRSQMYCPIEQQAAASDAAVAATKRQVVKYGGQVATTFFSSSSGGWTSSLSASWGSPDQPYLVPVRDRYDGAGGLNPNHTWRPVAYTTSGLASRLGVSGGVSS